MSEIKRYRLKLGAGKHHHLGQITKGGETLMLTEEEAERIKDKLEQSPVMEAAAPAASPAPVEESASKTLEEKQPEVPKAPEEPTGDPEAPKDAEPVTQQMEERKEENSKFVIQSVDGGFNVRNRETLVILNNQPLSYEDAEALVSQQ